MVLKVFSYPKLCGPRKCSNCIIYTFPEPYGCGNVISVPQKKGPAGS